MGMRNVNEDRKMLPKNWGVYAFRSWSYGIIIEISLPWKKKKKILAPEDFPDGPVVKTLPSKKEGAGLIPRQGAQILHALWLKKQNIKQKQCCDKFN